MATRMELTPFIWSDRPGMRHRRDSGEAFTSAQITSNVQRLRVALEEIWSAQQALAVPQAKLSELVFTSLNHIDTKDLKGDLSVWTDMHRSIQYALDWDFESARVTADGINGAHVQSDRRCVVLAARLVAHFFCGLLEAERFDHLLFAPQCVAHDLATHIARHQAAQRDTLRQSQLMSRSGLKPPQGLQSIAVLIQFFINALYGDGASLAGYLQVARAASVHAECGEESLFVYGLTQLIKGKLDRAQFCFIECHGEALRSGNRLLAALAGAELSVLEMIRQPGEALEGEGKFFALAEALQTWMAGQSIRMHSDGENRSPGCLDAKREQRLLLAVNYIEKNIATRVTTEILAEHCGVASRTISEDFRVAFKKTTLGYITDVRMGMALKLLKEQSLPIEEVARRVGFQSLLGFNKAFLRTYGSLPLALSRICE